MICDGTKSHSWEQQRWHQEQEAGKQTLKNMKELTRYLVLRPWHERERVGIDLPQLGPMMPTGRKARTRAPVMRSAETYRGGLCWNLPGKPPCLQLPSLRSRPQHLTPLWWDMAQETTLGHERQENIGLKEREEDRKLLQGPGLSCTKKPDRPLLWGTVYPQGD